jgi:DNA-binding beta-propeller fold protein YncE
MRTTTIIAVCAVLALGVPHAGHAAVHDHEIWALDQGTNTVHVYDPGLREVGRVALDGVVDTPHMVDFDSQGRFAFIANTRSGDVAVIRAADRRLVEVVATGATAHMAAVTPDDSAVWVANIGDRTLTEIVVDLDRETFTVGREVDFSADPLYQQTYGDWEAPPGPVCHQYSPDGRFAWVTLGPAAGGLVVVDLEALEIVTAFDPDVVRANCGVQVTADGAKVYTNWGSPTQDEGEWYVFDAAARTLLRSGGSRGVDVHGAVLTPDGAQLWQVNRHTNNAIVVDTASDEVVAEHDFVGDTPDILDFAPDGSRAYVSLRGPDPRSGDPHVATGSTPGFSVVDTASGEVVSTVQPAAGDERSDFHGIAVRPVSTRLARIAGRDRIETAIAVSQASFDDQGAGGVVLTRADDYADAVAGTPLAAAVRGPLLLSARDRLPDPVAGELARVLPRGSTVYVLGGQAAVSAAVAADVEQLGYRIRRLAGPTRYDTAVAVAEIFRDPQLFLLTTGHDFPDALAAGAVPAQRAGAVLLTDGDRAHPATTAFLDGRAGDRFAVGGAAARAHPEATRVAGSTREATAVAVARAFFPTGAAQIGVARADSFADALAAGPHIAVRGGPLLLTPGDGLHPEVAAWVCDHRDTVQQGYLYGGRAALSDRVAQGIGERIEGSGC